MAKPCCVLCGEEVPLLRRSSISLFRTTQITCFPCQQHYDNTSGPEREELIQRALRSPHLENREVVLKNQAIARETEADRQAKEAEKQAMLKRRKERQRAVLQCCGQPMVHLGTSTFQLGQQGWFLGDLPNLIAGSMDLAIFRCGCCGQIKTFDPRYLTDKIGPVFTDGANK